MEGDVQRAGAYGSPAPGWSTWLCGADALAACLGAPAGDPPSPVEASPFLADPPAAVEAAEVESVSVTRVTTFPPTRGDQKALALTLAKRYAVEEARRAKEEEVEEALRVKDNAEMKATAYHEEMSEYNPSCAGLVLLGYRGVIFVGVATSSLWIPYTLPLGRVSNERIMKIRRPA